MLDIKITRTTAPKAKPDESNLGFGKKFTDHMFVMDYTEGEGWHDARIVPYGPFELDPATVVFHYAQEIFEGMKAYRTADDTVQLFRPDCNAKRFQDSADRLCIPKIPVEDYIQAVETLVDVDRDWVPHSDGASLYIRPFVFANDVGLGVHASKHYIFCIICAHSTSSPRHRPIKRPGNRPLFPQQEDTNNSTTNPSLSAKTIRTSYNSNHYLRLKYGIQPQRQNIRDPVPAISSANQGPHRMQAQLRALKHNIGNERK